MKRFLLFFPSIVMMVCLASCSNGKESSSVFEKIEYPSDAVVKEFIQFNQTENAESEVLELLYPQYFLDICERNGHLGEMTDNAKRSISANLADPSYSIVGFEPQNVLSELELQYVEEYFYAFLPQKPQAEYGVEYELIAKDGKHNRRICAIEIEDLGWKIYPSGLEVLTEMYAESK